MTDTAPLSWTKRDVGAVTLPALAAFLVYLPALGLSFTSDDFFILDRIKTLGGLHDPLGVFPASRLLRVLPAARVSLARDRLDDLGSERVRVSSDERRAARDGEPARRGARAPFVRPPVALVGGLLFALHPASHEAVYWIAARFDLLATCFMLASLLWLLQRRRGVVLDRRGCFALALLSKESALSLPVIAAAADVIHQAAQLADDRAPAGSAARRRRCVCRAPIAGRRRRRDRRRAPAAEARDDRRDARRPRADGARPRRQVDRAGCRSALARVRHRDWRRDRRARRSAALPAGVGCVDAREARVRRVCGRSTSRARSCFRSPGRTSSTRRRTSTRSPA